MLAEGALQFGYAAITWGGRDREAIDDIAAVGFRGIQLRTAAVETFGDRPSELRSLLQQHRLTLVALSSGNVSVESDVAPQIERHVNNARFLRDAGGQYLQIIDQRPVRPLTPSDFATLARLLNQLGRRTADLGIPLVYHHHMNSVGEAPDEVARILDATDAQYVHLLFDVAHYQQGGGDPVRAIHDFASRIRLFHLKDVENRPPEGQPASRAYRFVELGRGRIDLPGVMRAIHDEAFRGWVVVELDGVPDHARTPRESAEINRRYLVDTLHQTL